MENGQPQKFFHLISPDINLNIVGSTKFFFPLSLILIAITLVSLFTKGLNYGVDFKGGSEVQLRFYENTDAATIRSALKPIGFSDAVVQGVGEKGSGQFLIRVEQEDLRPELYKEQFQQALDKVSPVPNSTAKIRYSEDRIYVSYDQDVPVEVTRAALQGIKLGNLEVDSVTPFGKASAHEVVVIFSGAAQRIIEAISKKYGRQKFEVLQVEQVGAKVGSELRMQAIGAILISIVLIFIFVWFRFEFEFAPGAILALIHDPLMILGMFSVLGLTFDLSSIAAILTIVGFSINDTIVVFDRVRENLRKVKDPDLAQVINTSVNETLGRTVLTSGTVFLTTLALLFLGGPVTFNFSLAFAVGVISGTYSTVFVAGPVTIYLDRYLRKRRLAA